MRIVHWFIEDAVWLFPFFFQWDGKKQKQDLTSQPISVFSSYGPGAGELKYFYWAPNILLIQNYTSVRVRSVRALGFSLPAFQYCGNWVLNIYLTLMTPAQGFLFQMFLLYSLISATYSHVSDTEYKKPINLDYCSSLFYHNSNWLMQSIFSLCLCIPPIIQLLFLVDYMSCQIYWFYQSCLSYTNNSIRIEQLHISYFAFKIIKVQMKS